MTPSTPTDALALARIAWLGGQRDAWTRYAAAVGRLIATLPAAGLPPRPFVRAPRATA